MRLLLRNFKKNNKNKTPLALWFLSSALFFRHPSKQIQNCAHAHRHAHICKRKKELLPTLTTSSLKHSGEVQLCFLNIPRGWRSPGSLHSPWALQRDPLWDTSPSEYEWPSCWGHRTRAGTGQAMSRRTQWLCHLQNTSTSPGSLDKQHT